MKNVVITIAAATGTRGQVGQHENSNNRQPRHDAENAGLPHAIRPSSNQDHAKNGAESSAQIHQRELGFFDPDVRDHVVAEVGQNQKATSRHQRPSRGTAPRFPL